ncbi:MAG: hypothetical protein HYW48_12265 [Deltaproteobacteria bacterium]|nr:hypothetical protein [Deltaproteobacteria bacterium]
MAQTDLHAFVKILQNGRPISSITMPLRRKKIYVSSSIKKELSIPFYGFPKKNILLLKTKKKEPAELVLSLPFEGLVVTDGETTQISPTAPLGTSFPMKNGDYAALHHKDLVFLVKIASFVKELEPPLNPYYAPKLWSFLLHDKNEAISLTVGLCGSLFLFVCICLGFLLRPFDAPRRLEQLDQEYILPFIEKDTFSTSPEALKFNLDRLNYIPPIVKYYRNYTHLMVGFPLENHELVYPSSISLAYKKNEEMKGKIASKENIQRDLDSATASSKDKGTLSIPASYEGSFQNKLLEIIEKFTQIQSGFKKSLASRRFVTQEYLEDAEYDWGNYFQEKTVLKKKKQMEAISKISVFGQLTNEEWMYDVGEKLGKKAEILRRHYDMLRDKNTWLSRDSIVNVYLPSSLTQASFLNNPNFDLLDRKIYLITATRVSNKK